MKKIYLVCLLAFTLGFGSAQNVVPQPYTSPGTSTFNVPAGINTVTVECWGGGGGGGGTGGSGGAGGGGGGAYSKLTLSVTPLSGYTVNVGVGGPFGNGPGGNGQPGGDSWFSSMTTILAKGGGGGLNGGGPGAGGFASASIGSPKFDGGMGGVGASGGPAQGGGGGGSSAGSLNVGNPGIAGTSGGSGVGGPGGIAPSGGGNGGNGGNDSQPSSVFPGLSPGGGGGGAGAMSGGTFGGAGANGQVIVSYTQPTILSVDPGVSDGSYKIGDVITIGITFSDVMNVTGGTPTLSLNTSPARSATYSSVTGSTIHFTYTIQAGDISAGLDYTTTTALISNGASIASSPDQNIAVLTLPTPGGSGSLGANSNIVVDGIAPASPSAPALDQSDDSGISNTDNITAIDANLTLTGTAEAGTTIAFYDAIIGFLGSTSATGGVYSFDVDLGSDTYSITATAEDAAGNISTASVPLNLVVDTGNPNVDINQSGTQQDPTSSLPISFDVVFDEAVYPGSFSFGDINLGGTATGQSVAGLTTSDNINWLLTVSASDAGTIIPTISAGILEDLAGNTNTASSSTDHTVTYQVCTLPVLTTEQTNHFSCFDPSGTAKVTAVTPSPGTEPATYTMQWYVGALATDGEEWGAGGSVSGTMGLTVGSLFTGQYTAKVTNDEVPGCFSTVTVNILDIVVYPNLTPSFIANTSCSVVSPNGSATVTATTSSGEPSSYYMSWHNGTTTGGTVVTSDFSIPGSPGLTASALVDGDYTVEVINNDNSCASVVTVTVPSNQTLPTITLGTSPSITQGTTSANLPYSGTTNAPDQYSIDFNSAAEGAGFVDVNFTALPGTPITITVPGGAPATTYNASITVTNSATLCASSPSPFTVQVTAPPPPVITAVTIPNVAMKIGDLVTATINVSNSPEAFTLGASTINSYTLGNLIKSNNTTYTAEFNILAGGADVIPSGSIPISIVLTGVGGSNTPFTTAIAQPNDPIDANAPVAPTIPDLNVGDDSGASNTDKITNLTSALTFGGTAETGATINIYLAGSTLIGTGVAASGSYSIDVSLAAGTHSITAIATDVAGNVGAASSALSVTVDTTPPSVTLNQAGGQVDPTSTLPVNFTAVFSEAINASTFTGLDFTLNGSAIGQSVGTLGTSDNITWTVPLNATGPGTFTPLIPAGGIQDVAGNNSNGSTSTDNSVTYSTAPTTQATNITFPSSTATTLNISWTSGNGANRLVVGKSGSAVNATPVDGTGYTANAAFGGGTQLGSGNFVVFSGSGSSVTVTGLTAGTTYHFQVFEFNGNAGSSTYLITTAAGNPASAATPFSEPTTQASSVSFLAVTSTSMNVLWVNGDGTSRLVVARESIAASFTPSDGTAYTANSDFSLATDLGSGNKVVYSGTGSSVSLTGLTPSTTYHFKIFEFNGSGVTANYASVGPNANQATSAPTFNMTVASLSTGLATSPLVAGTTNQAVLGFSFSSDATQTVTGINVQLSSDPSGKLANWTLVRSTDNSFTSAVDNAVVGGLVLTIFPNQVVITGLNEVQSVTAKNYFLVADVDPSVSGATPSIQASVSASNVTVSVGTVSGSTTGPNYSFTTADTTPPTVSSINYQVPANSPTNATSLTFRVIFSEAVTGVASADFTPILSGVTIGAITVNPIDALTYDVTFTTASGNGTARCDVINTATITDLASNAYVSTFTTGQVYTVDQTAPLISATAPASSATVSNTQVSYTLSEAIASGTITWTQTGGTADGGSPHTQTLTGTELTTGAHPNITLTNNPTLVNGAIYSIAFNGTDAAGNTATAVTNTNVTFNTATAPVVTAVAIPNVAMNIGDVVTATITVNSNTEAFTLGTSSIGGFALSGLVKSNNTTYTAQFTVTAGGTDVAAGSNIPVSVVMTGIAGSNSPFTTAIVQASDPIDANRPAFSATAPASSATVSNTQVSYTLSEAIASGTITWTQTGGTTDANSPHVQVLTGTELTSGGRTNVTLTNNPTLVSGAIYSIAFNGTDAAGNTATAVTNTNVLFSTATAPVVTAVAIPNVAMNIGDVVTATITVNSSTEAFTLGTSSIGGFALSGLVKSSNTTYTAQFTVTAGGTDVAAGSNIPVSVVMTGIAGSNSPFTTAIVQASDPIDANRPAFSATAPATNATVSNTQVSYTLSEAIASGSITWTRTGGTTDANSPHVQTLSGAELASGAHANIALTSNPTLVSGAIYSLAFNGTDAAGNTATVVTNTNVTFGSDATPPMVVSIIYQTPAASPTNATSLTFRVTFSESVTGVAAADFAQTVTGATTGAISVSVISQSVYNVTIASVAGVGTVRLDVSASATIIDLAGNAFTGGFTSGQVYAVDTIVPVISSTSPATGSVIQSTAVSFTLSEALASGSVTWTRTGGTADAGSPHVQSLTGTELATGPHTNITLSNNPTLVSGTVYSVAFTGTDAAGNTATVTNTNVTFDNSVPTVISIVYQTPANALTNASSLTFRVTFSEAVLNVDAADFTKTLSTGVAGGTITVTPVSTSVYDVTFPVAGSGTVRLDVLGTASITDANGNALSANFITGNVYTLDQTPPVFSNTSPASSSIINSTQVSYTLSENLSAGTITWTRTGGTADGTVHTQDLVGNELNSGAHSNILLASPPSLVAGAVYTVAFAGVDAAGNNATVVTSLNVTYTPAPIVLSDIVANSTFSYPQNIDYVNFQEATDLQSSATSIEVARFDIRDGGTSAPDADPFPTVITSLTLDLGTNFSLLRRIALYDATGQTEISGTEKAIANQTVSFNNLTISCPDNAALSFTIRVSFVTEVTDNLQFSFTIAEANSESGNSGLAAPDGGGAVSSTANNSNRIEVIATEFRFIEQPANTLINEIMATTISVEAVDVNGNRDLDFSGSVGIASSGTLSSSPSASLTDGFGISTDIAHSASGEGLTLTTVNTSGLTEGTSSVFDIYENTSEIKLVIHSVITPTNSDEQNNVLYIENIDFFPENSVQIIDRWGIPIKSWTNFSNYANAAPDQPDFDFSGLNVGNYICVVEFKDSTSGNKKSQTQMITVLK